MAIRLGFFADLHLNAAFRQLDDGGSRRRTNLRNTLQRIVEVCADRDVDAILCAGDLYEHRDSPADTRNFLKKTFMDAGVPILIAPGNHDWHGPESLYATCDWSSNVHVFTEARFKPFELGDHFTIWGAAHKAEVGTPGFFEDGFKVDGGGVHLALFHGAELGIPAFMESGADGNPKAHHASFEEADIANAGFAYAFVGHYHSQQDRSTMSYAGNPDPLTFGEGLQEGLVIAEVGDDGGVTIDRVNVAVSESHDLVVDVTGCDSQADVEAQFVEATSGLSGWARVTVSGALNPEVRLDLEALGGEHGNLQVSCRPGEITSAYDIDSIANEESVRGEFVRRVVAEAAEKDARPIIELGLRAFDGHSLGV